MKRIHPVSLRPEHAATATTDVKLTFIITILQASIPLLNNKDPQNPGATSTSTGGAEGES